MRFFKTALCIALLSVATDLYANSENFRQKPDSLALDETPVYADVLKKAYSFLLFSPDLEDYPWDDLFFNTGWVNDGTENFQKLKIYADDYLTEHYGKFIFELGTGDNKRAYFVKFFEGTVEPISPQNNGYGPQDEQDNSLDEEIIVFYHPDNNEKVPFARFGTSEMCYISLQDTAGSWYFVFIHSGILCY